MIDILDTLRKMENVARRVGIIRAKYEKTNKEKAIKELTDLLLGGYYIYAIDFLKENPDILRDLENCLSQ